MQDTEPANPICLILASSSPYRRALLQRLGVSFRWRSPDIDESPRPGETPRALVSRLARDKADAIGAHAGRAVVIGSDQVAMRGDTVLGKPGDRETARLQLLECAGQEVCFYTAAVVTDLYRSASEEHIDETRVAFRSLQPEEIDRYLDAEQPYDCAGGFKAEQLGISLFWRIKTEDPTALTGLPLIWLGAALRRCGLQIP